MKQIGNEVKQINIGNILDNCFRLYRNEDAEFIYRILEIRKNFPIKIGDYYFDKSIRTAIIRPIYIELRNRMSFITSWKFN